MSKFSKDWKQVGLNHALWHKFWFYRNIFPYGYKLGRGFLWRKIKI